MADLRRPRLTRTERLDLYGGFIDFLQQVWAWILDYWYVVLIIGGALAAVIFTKPMKRPEPPKTSTTHSDQVAMEVRVSRKYPQFRSTRNAPAMRQRMVKDHL